MRKEIKIKNGKALVIPARMFKNKDLENMDIDFVEKKIFFNKSDSSCNFPPVSDEVKANMRVIDYEDFSNTKYSREALTAYIESQIDNDKDFILIPAFKKEGEPEIIEKLELSRRLKTMVNKDIIFEVSYKAIPQEMKRIIENADSFDILGIFYGVHYGRHSSFIELSRKIFSFREKTGKKIFCMGVPLIFAGDIHASNSHLLPVWEFISDAWVRNWKPGGGGSEIRLIDYADLKNKNFQGWCEKHKSDEIVSYVNVSILSLFRRGLETQRLRERYTRILVDEAVNEASLLAPEMIWKYLMKNVPEMYQTVIIRLYDQRLIQYSIRELNWAKTHPENEVELLERELMDTFDPSELDKKIKIIVEIATRDEKISVTELISELDKMRSVK